MSDLIDRIKGLRYVHVPQASQLFEEAIAEIERLRLTAAERSAIADAADRYAAITPESAETAVTLRNLLDRIGHQEGRE